METLIGVIIAATYTALAYLAAHTLTELAT